MIRDSAGNILPTGRVTQQIDWDFMGGVIPSTLEVSAASTGTATAVGPSLGNVPHVRLRTAATLNDVIRLRTSFDVDASLYTALDIALEGVWFDAGPAGGNVNFVPYLRLDATDGTGGVQLLHTSARADVKQFAAGPTESAVSLPYMWRDGPTRRQNLRLRWEVKAKRLYVLQDDAVMWEQTTNFAAVGLVRPGIALQAKEAYARNMYVSRMVLRLEHN